MSLKDLLADAEWDRPIYKRLAHNDTGAASGHQAGLVIPKSLRSYLPGLNPQVSANRPTVDKYIRADLIVDYETVSCVETRYQYQTWGGTRSPESRLTDNLGDLRNEAVGGDYVVIQRSISDLGLYRLILVRQGSPDYKWMVEKQNARRWGVLTAEYPLREEDLWESRDEQRRHESQEFDLFDERAQTITRKTVQLARSIIFRDTLLRIYEGECAVCQSGLRTERFLEVEGAHIVPRSRAGANDARNGLALCRTHHWAFDHGLFGIDTQFRVIVPSASLMIEENAPLRNLDGVKIKRPSEEKLLPAQAALKWHRENLLVH